MRVCAVCKIKYPKGSGTLFRVPKDKLSRKRWSEICREHFLATARICSKHFLPTSIIHVGGTVNLLPNAEPFMRQTQETTDNLNQDMDQQDIKPFVKSKSMSETFIKNWEPEENTTMKPFHNNWIFDPEQPESHSAKDYEPASSCIKQEFFKKESTFDDIKYVPTKTTTKEGSTQTENICKDMGTQTEKSSLKLH